MPDTKDQRDSHRVRMQSLDELCRADGRARHQVGHRSSSCSTDHHVYRLHHFRRLSRSGHSHISIISRTEGNIYIKPYTYMYIDRRFNRSEIKIFSWVSFTVGQNDDSQESLRVPADS